MKRLERQSVDIIQLLKKVQKEDRDVMQSVDFLKRRLFSDTGAEGAGEEESAKVLMNF